jgi:RimJ/RimL family protein N-acetyltransferase
MASGGAWSSCVAAAWDHGRVELRDVTVEDLPLYRRMMTDPRMMAELGSPLAEEGLREKWHGIVDSVRDGSVWYLAIVPDPESEETAGTVCVWEHEWRGNRINEMGWMVLPEHQGRGLASNAVRCVLDRARAENRWGAIHAFPGVTNGPSNAICRTAGFEQLEVLDFEYADRLLRCNHWRVDLRSGSGDT